MKRRLSIVFAVAPLLSSFALGGGQEVRRSSDPHIVFEAGKSVYVVGVEAASRDLSLTRANLEIERRAKEQFRKRKSFLIANSLQSADFVFLVVLDAQSEWFDETALVVDPESYAVLGNNIDALRLAAIWQDSSHLDTKKRLTTTTVRLTSSSLAAINRWNRG
jgi:hypothetical protein